MARAIYSTLLRPACAPGATPPVVKSSEFKKNFDRLRPPTEVLISPSAKCGAPRARGAQPRRPWVEAFALFACIGLTCFRPPRGFCLRAAQAADAGKPMPRDA